MIEPCFIKIHTMSLLRHKQQRANTYAKAGTQQSDN